MCMRVLISNDDGIQAEGIKALSLAFKTNGHQVAIVAPDSERSASGHAITVHQPLRVQRGQLAGIDSFAINGTPADCVKLALDSLIDWKPDIVVSGINRGPNLGTDVLYSGTVSAAIEAALDGLPAIAVSLASYEKSNYENCAVFTVETAEKYHREKLPYGTLLNINMPNIKPDKIKGVKITKLGERKYFNNFERRIDPRGGEYFWLAGQVDESNPDPHSDVWAIINNYISVTPIHFDLTNHYFLNKLNQWQLNFKE